MTLLIVGAAAAGVGGYLIATDQDVPGWATAGAGAGLALGGITVLVW